MDGTLLDSNNEISEKTKETIKKAEEKGAYIVIATGRLLKSALHYAETLKLKTPLIACNGAIIVDEFKKIIYEKTLEKKKVKEIIKLGIKKDIYFHFYDEESFYSTIRAEEILKFYGEGSGSLDIGLNIFDDIDLILNKDDLNVYKFIFVDENRKKLEKLRYKLDEIKGIETSSSWINNIEVMAERTSKGYALKELCKRLAIKPKEVMAIGDNENDLSMIEFAGMGVAMGNGNEIIKNKADYITSTNDQNGLAKVIEKFIL